MKRLMPLTISLPSDEGEDSSLDILMSSDEYEEIKSTIEQMPEFGKIVEWGSGGSTLAWLALLKPTQKLVSIEHNKEWYDKINNWINDRSLLGSEFTYILCPPMYPDYDHGYAKISEEHPYGLREYIIPPSVNGTVLDADIYFIDGIARAAVAAVILLFSKNDNAIYYIHDYTGREHWYDWLLGRITHKKIIGTLVKFSKNKDII